MTHRLGRVVTDGRSVNQANGIDLTPGLDHTVRCAS